MEAPPAHLSHHHSHTWISRSFNPFELDNKFGNVINIQPYGVGLEASARRHVGLMKTRYLSKYDDTWKVNEAWWVVTQVQISI